MEQLNKKIKDIYNKEQASLPPELKWDEMKEGIFEKMKEQEDEPAPIFAFWFEQKKWWLSIAALLLVVASIFTHLKLNDRNLKSTNSNNINNNGTTVKIDKETSNKKIKAKDEKSIENDSEIVQNDLVSNNEETLNIKEVIPAKNKALNNASIADTNQNSIVEKAKPDKALSKTSYSITSTKKQVEAIVENFRISNENETQSIGKILIHPKNKQTLDRTKNQTVKPIITSKTKFKVVELLTKKSPDLNAHSQSSLLLKEMIKSPIIEKPTDESKSYQALQLDGGFIYLFSFYKKSDNKQYLAEKGFPSIYTSLTYYKVFRKNIYISTGLNYSKYKTKFELSDTIMHTYLVENAHTLSINNVVTGKTSDFYEDVNVDAQSLRTVRHYNQFNAIGIPIIIGRQFEYKKLICNIGLGSDISFYNQSVGKTLRANKVINYSQKDILPYNNKVQVATLLELGMGLAVSKHMDIIANFRYKKHLVNWANDNLSIKPQAVLLGTGLKFKF